MWKVNQTLIKKLKKEYCPRYVKDVMLDGFYPSVPSEAMIKGIVFEQSALDLPVVHSMPKLKNGAMSTDEVRIDAQAKLFKSEVIPEYNIQIEETQLYVEHEYSPGVILHGKLDFTATMIDEELSSMPIPIVADLKLTGNIYSQFGDFSWAWPHNMDHTQAFLYTQLMKWKFDQSRVFYYFVFDYKPVPEYKIIRKRVEGLDIAELNESIRSTVAKLDYHKNNGWAEAPSHENCKLCPVADFCSSYKPKKPIEVV